MGWCCWWSFPHRNGTGRDGKFEYCRCCLCLTRSSHWPARVVFILESFLFLFLLLQLCAVLSKSGTYFSGASSVTGTWLTADCCVNGGKQGPAPVPSTCAASLLTARLYVIAFSCFFRFRFFLFFVCCFFSSVFTWSLLFTFSSLFVVVGVYGRWKYASSLSGTIPSVLSSLSALTSL